jgi:hypothetical protein
LIKLYNTARKKENHTEEVKRLIVLVEITEVAFGAEITGFISLAKLCTYGKNSNKKI